MVVNVLLFKCGTFFSTSPGFLIFLFNSGGGALGVAPSPNPPSLGMNSIGSTNLMFSVNSEIKYVKVFTTMEIGGSMTLF